MLRLDDLQAVADLILEKDNYPNRVMVEVRLIKAGYSRRKQHKVVIPFWALKRGDDYAIYYTIHEIAHIVSPPLSSHGTRYKQVEDRLLGYWEFMVKRKKVYPRTLYSRGQMVYTTVNPILLCSVRE